MDALSFNVTPKISVVIITYNFGRYIRECVESVLSQTLPPFEIIICDDHSTDDSWDIIDAYSRKYSLLIRAYRQEKNIGPFENSNFAGELASGDLVSFIEGDDRWLPQKLELEWKALRLNPDAQLAYSNVYSIDADGKRIKVWNDDKEYRAPNGDVFIQTFSRRFFSNSSSLFRNELVRRLSGEEDGKSDENLLSFWDWDRKIRLTARFQVAYSGAALVERREHAGGFSKSQPEVHSQAFVQVYEKNLPLLAYRSREDALRVMVNIEGRLSAKRSITASSHWGEAYTPQKVLDRIVSLFRSLSVARRKKIEQELNEHLVKIALAATREALKDGNRHSALRNYRILLRYVSIIDPEYAELGARVLLSGRAYNLFRKIFASLGN